MRELWEQIGMGRLGRPVALRRHRACGRYDSVRSAAAAWPAGKRPNDSGGVATPTDEKHHLPVPEQYGRIRRPDFAVDASGSL